MSTTMRTGFEVGANIGPFEQAMRRMVGVSREAGQGVTGSFESMTAPLANIQMAYAAIAGVITGALVGGFVKLSDQAALANARIQQVTGSAHAASEANRSLYEMAQRLQTPYAELQQTFARMMPSVREMGGGVNEATKLAEILTSTAKMAGASSAEASASALQFAQALGSGVLQGDELKSILENNQVLARELAAGLGVSVGELKELGAQGELTSDKVATALLERADQIAAAASDLPDTVGGAYTEIENSVGKLVEALNNQSGVTEYVIEVMKGLADVLDVVTSSLNSVTGASNTLGANDGAASFGQRVSLTFAELIDYGRTVYHTIMMVVQAANALQRSASLTMNGQFSEAQKQFDAIYDQAIQHGVSAVDAAKNAGQGYRDKALNNAIQGMLPKDGDFGANAFTQSAKLTAPKSTGGGRKKTGGGAKKKGGSKKQAGSSRGGSTNVMSQWNAELQAQKTAYAEMQAAQGTWQEFSKASEIAFWRDKLQRVNAGSKEGLQIRQKIASLELALHKETTKEAQRLGKEAIDAQRATDLHNLAMAEAASDTALALSQSSNMMRLQQQALFEDQRYQIELKAIQDRIELQKQDPHSSPEALAQLHEKLLELERQYQLKKAQIGGQQAVARRQEAPTFMEGMQDGAGNWLNGIPNAFSQVYDSIVQRTASLRQALGNAFQQIGNAFVNEVVMKPLAQLAIRAVKESALWSAIFGVQITGQAAAATATTATKAAETTAVVGGNAAQAASGAAASQASIPYIGPALAMAAAAAMMAFVSGFGGGGGGSSTSTSVTRIPSAAAGWDIPAGINPLAQLHEQEMVLPAAQANVIRDMADGGGMGGGPIVINASGGDWVHKRDLAKLLKTMKKDYRFT